MKMICLPVGPLQANCYLVWDDGHRACAVDPGGEPDRVVATLARESLALEAIFVTHGHFDHLEGVAGVATATQATVYCHREIVPVLEGAQGCPASGFPIPAVPSGSITPISGGDKVQVGDLSIAVIATPGHTPADVTYDIGGSLFCGDLLFRGSVGRTDFPGGDFDALIASISRVVSSYPPSTPVYPGHMEATTLAAELAHNPFLAALPRRG
jgi:glyoxylase-like metal-dependent hydrolase (beta-lactamase superfamily II)